MSLNYSLAVDTRHHPVKVNVRIVGNLLIQPEDPAAPSSPAAVVCSALTIARCITWLRCSSRPRVLARLLALRVGHILSVRVSSMEVKVMAAQILLLSCSWCIATNVVIHPKKNLRSEPVLFSSHSPYSICFSPWSQNVGACVTIGKFVL